MAVRRVLQPACGLPYARSVEAVACACGFCQLQGRALVQSDAHPSRVCTGRPEPDDVLRGTQQTNKDGARMPAKWRWALMLKGRCRWLQRGHASGNAALQLWPPGQYPQEPAWMVRRVVIQGLGVTVHLCTARPAAEPRVLVCRACLCSTALSVCTTAHPCPLAAVLRATSCPVRQRMC